MNIKKKLLAFGIFFLLISPAIAYAQVCEVGKIKQILRKTLYLYLINEGGVDLTLDELKDILIFYLSIDSQNLTIDCSPLGSKSNRPIYDVINEGDKLPDRIPSCGDDTKYGHCSGIKPGYCYAGEIHSKCDICGCPMNSVCGKSGRCDRLSQNITCWNDIDCGENRLIGDYYCQGNYITRDYTNQTCQNPGTVGSKCIAYNGTASLYNCDPTSNQVCVNGQSTCGITITDLAPTVSISVTPNTIAQGQAFNVTVAGTDDVGIDAIWWWAKNTSDTELVKAHWHSCNNLKYCSRSWIVSTNAVGAITLGANSRDSAYPVAGQPHQASEGDGIAYTTVTVGGNASPATSIITIRGRLVDKNTRNPVSNVRIFTDRSSTGQALSPVDTNSNGEFAITTSTDITSAKMFPYWPECYIQGHFVLQKNSDDSLTVRLHLFDLIRGDKSFTVTGSELNLGDIPLWPAVDVGITSIIPVKFNVAYPEEGRSVGNIMYKTSHYLSNVIPLEYNIRIKATDSPAVSYYSPYKKFGLEQGCAPARLELSDGQLDWEGATQTNTSNCFVKIDGATAKSVYATDRNDCYSKTSFGSINCKTYEPYFTDGVHFLEQYFGTVDRVNNEYCTCANGACVQGNQTQESVTLHELFINGSDLYVSYSKNFDTCVHLLTSGSRITHTQNHYCSQGSYISNIVSLGDFDLGVGQNYKLCHGNNYGTCSALKILTNVTQTNVSKPDLIVSDIIFTQTNPTTSSIVETNVTVKNIGTSTSGSSVLHITDNYRLSVPSLSPSQTFSVKISQSLSAGTYSKTATADKDSTVAELNENNNIMTKSITVTAPTANTTQNSTNESNANQSIRPPTVTLEGADGTWCLDSDGNGGYFIKGYCIDSTAGTLNDFCDGGTARDYYCTGSWNGAAWNNVKCTHGGYFCTSGGYTCSDGACVN